MPTSRRGIPTTSPHGELRAVADPSDAGSARALIEVTGATRAYVGAVETVWAARDVDLSVNAGELVVIYGASGSGKTTLLNLIAGLDRPDSGSVIVADQDVGQLSQGAKADLRLRTVGVVFQEHRLLEEFTALENVMLPLEARGWSFEASQAAARLELSRVGLLALDDRYPAEMSGGQRQRVGIARALVGDRRIILADEPTGSLDSAASHELFTVIRSLCDQGTLAILFTHDPASHHFADRMFEMVDGCLRQRSLAS